MFNLFFKKINYTHLHLAILIDDENIVELLLDNGADLSIPDYLGYLPIFSSINSSNINVLSRILEHTTNKNQTFKNCPIVNFTVKEQKIKHLALLIGFSFPIDLKDENGLTPSQLAKKLQNIEIFHYLDDENLRQQLKLLPKRQIGQRIVEKFSLNIDTYPIERTPIKKEIQKKEIPKKKKIIIEEEDKKELEIKEKIENNSIFITKQNLSNINNSISREEFSSLTKRIIFLEEILSSILLKYSDLNLFKPQICHSCNNNYGLNICPVCGKYFCNADWYIHVSKGCRMK